MYYVDDIREFREKKKKTKTKKMHRGWCSWRVLPGFGILLSQICSRDMTWTCWDFQRFFTTSFELRAVDRGVFCHLSPRPVSPAAPFAETCFSILNPYHAISAVTALQAAAHLEVACSIFFVSCVMSIIYLSIDLSVHFSPGLLSAAAAAGFVCYTAVAILPAATS